MVDVTNHAHPSTHELVKTEKRVEEEGMREERSPVRQAQGIFKNNLKNFILGCKIMMMALNQFAK